MPEIDRKTRARLGPIVTQHSRTRITRAVYQFGVWIGSRRGIPLEFHHYPKAAIGDRISWKYRVRGSVYVSGHATDVWNALQEIERSIATRAISDRNSREHATA